MGVIMKNGRMYGQRNNADGITVTDTYGVLGIEEDDVTMQEMSDGLAESLGDLNQAISDLDGSVVKSVNTKTPTNGAVEVTAEDIPADGIGDKTVSGNPIVIEDGMASVAKGLSVTLEPIQDLHGYESPWIGTDVDKQPYLFRAISDSSVQDKGTHELDKIVGGTVAWNQLVQNGNFADTSGWTTARGTISVANNVCTYTVNEPSSTTTGNRIVNTLSQVTTANHVLLASAEIKAPKAVIPAFEFNSSPSIYKGLPALTANVNTRIAVFVKSTAPISQVYVGISNAASYGYEAGDTVEFKNVQLFDLTQMFGSTVADAILAMEQSTWGAGVAWFRNLFPAPYYPYNAGELISVKTSAHKTIGFNQFDKDNLVVFNAYLQSNQGQYFWVHSSDSKSTVIKCLPNTTYCVYTNGLTPTILRCGSTAMSTLPTGSDWTIPLEKQFSTSTEGILSYTTGANAKWLVVQTNFAIFNDVVDNLCINLSDPSKNGTYEPYTEHSYPLDSDLELRGIPKLDSNNNLYYDGDIYEASGNVQRKYGIVDLGTLTWLFNATDSVFADITDLKSATENLICQNLQLVSSSTTAANMPMNSFKNSGAIVVKVSGITAENAQTMLSGVYLVYELATPTAETADPYTSTQVIDPDGTEEYVDTRTVPIPVGHESNYANICPIEGRTVTEVGRHGINQWDEEWEVGGINNTTGENEATNSLIRTKNFIPVIPNTQYYFKSPASTDINGTLFFYDKSLNFLSLIYSRNSVFTTPSNAHFMKFKMNATYGTTYNNDISINYPATETAHHAYSEDTVSVSFGQTVYGCTHDFVTGKCRVTHALVDMGSLIWSRSNSSTEYYFFYTYPDNFVGGFQFTSSGYENLRVVRTQLLDKTMGIFSDNSVYNSQRICVRDDAYTDVETFISAVTGMQLCYPLETPIELTLTPAQLSLLQGTNILTADGAINLTYLGSMAANVQDEITEFENGLNNVIGSIAFIENSTAKTSHAVGDYVILNGIFCKVISAISSGETLSFGTNIQATTIGAELRAIWAQLSA